MQNQKPKKTSKPIVEPVVLDARGISLGRIASRVAFLLRGKNSPSYRPWRLDAKKIVVTNARQIRITGKKPQQKVYRHHTHHPGGLKSITLGELLRVKPTAALHKAVMGMLPKNKLRKEMIRQLEIRE